MEAFGTDATLGENCAFIGVDRNSAAAMEKIESVPAVS